MLLNKILILYKNMYYISTYEIAVTLVTWLQTTTTILKNIKKNDNVYEKYKKVLL